MPRLLVVGACLAGVATVRAAREQGYAGEIVVVGEERHRPYDRPPLSKDFLLGRAQAGDITLDRDGEDLGATWLLGVRATALDGRRLVVTLDDGERLAADDIVIATGAEARRLDLPGHDRPGVHTLRTLDDALALRAALHPDTRVVVIGAGFIGSEVASSAHALGCEVTVLEAAATPLSGALGAQMGAVVGTLHERNGVGLRCNVTIREFTGDEPGASVTGVILDGGEVVPADVVVVGVGARPAVDWLAGSGLRLDGGVLCDATGHTSLPHIAAVGDCASWLDPATGRSDRVEHWTDALNRPALTVAALLATGATTRPRGPAYFWSDQYGARIQFAGRPAQSTWLTIDDGSTDEMSFVAVYWAGDRPVAVLGVNSPKQFTRWRKRLADEARRDSSSLLP